MNAYPQQQEEPQEHLVTLSSTESVAELFQRTSDELGLLPQVGGKVTVCVADGGECCLEGVLKGLGGAGRGSVDIFDTSKLEETLDGWGSDETGTTGSWDETNRDGTALAALLCGKGMWETQIAAPVTSSDGQNAQLGDDDGGTDGGCDFLGGLDTETNVALGITNNDDGLESGTLTSTSLFLDGLDLHNLILQLRQEEIHNLVLLDGQRMQIDLLHGLDLPLLHQPTQLGDRLPLLLLVLVRAPTRPTASAATAPITTISSSVAAGTESTAASCCSSSWCVSHDSEK